MHEGDEHVRDPRARRVLRGPEPRRDRPPRAGTTTDLGALLDVVRRRWALAAACVLLGGLAAVLQSVLATPQYAATTTVLLSLEGAQTPNELLQGSSYTQQLAQSYARVATTPAVLEPVVRQLGLDTDPADLAASVAVEAPAESTLLDVTVTRADPGEAAAVARAVVEQLPLVATASSTPGREGIDVRTTTVAPAQVPTSPVSPRPALGLVVGLGAGALLGVLAVAARELQRSPVTGRTAVAAVTDLPVLAVLPPVRRTRRARRGAARPASRRGRREEALADAHRVLRDELRLPPAPPPGAPRVAHVLGVAACTPATGSTACAAGLARAVAETGRRVLLVDADLRGGDVAAAVGALGGAGLSTALGGQAAWGDLVQPWARRGVDVLAAGPVPSDAGALLARPALGDLLAEARARYDLVVVRTAAALPRADTGTVAPALDGLVLVAESRATSTRELDEVLTRVSAGGARVLGVVLTRGDRDRGRALP